MQSVHLNGEHIAFSSCYFGSAARVRTCAFVIHSLHGRHRYHRVVIWYETPQLADDNQIYSSCFRTECFSLKIKVIDCIDVVDKWMASNRLMLNPSKSEFLCLSSSRRVLLINKSAFVFLDGSVDVSLLVVRKLGAFFNVTMSMKFQINRYVRSS